MPFFVSSYVMLLKTCHARGAHCRRHMFLLSELCFLHWKQNCKQCGATPQTKNCEFFVWGIARNFCNFVPCGKKTKFWHQKICLHCGSLIFKALRGLVWANFENAAHKTRNTPLPPNEIQVEKWKPIYSSSICIVFKISRLRRIPRFLPDTEFRWKRPNRISWQFAYKLPGWNWKQHHHFSDS